MAQKGKPFLTYVNRLPVEAAPDSADAIYLGGESSRRTNPGQIGSGPGGEGAVDSVNGFIGVVNLTADHIPDAATTNKFATQAQLDFVDSLVTDPTLDGIVTHDGADTVLKRTAGGGTYLTLQSDTANYVAFEDENGVSLGYIDVDASGNYWRFRNDEGTIFFQYERGNGVVTFPHGGTTDVSFVDLFSGSAPIATAFKQTWVPSDTNVGYIWSDTGDGIVANGTWVQFSTPVSLLPEIIDGGTP